MHRLLIGLLFCLPLCLLMAPSQSGSPSGSGFSIPLERVTDDEAVLPDAARMEYLAQTDPVAFIESEIGRAHV